MLFLTGQDQMNLIFMCTLIRFDQLRSFLNYDQTLLYHKQLKPEAVGAGAITFVKRKVQVEPRNVLITNWLQKQSACEH